MSQLLIRNGSCVSPEGVFQSDLLVQDGRIAAVETGIQGQFDQVIDAQGCYVLPGGVDVHVHLPWPTGQFISLDDFSSGTKAAAFGGVTTIIDFVIPEDAESLNQALERKLRLAEGCAHVDYSFHLNIRGDLKDKLAEIPGLVARGFPSFKVFMAYEGFRLDDGACWR
jgi:dihydropyrimidinase